MISRIQTLISLWIPICVVVFITSCAQVTPSSDGAQDSAAVAKLDDELVVHYFNVGTGMCQLVECPGDNAPVMLVDCGSKGYTNDDMTLADVKAAIDGVLNGREPIVVISHGDGDHHNYLDGIFGDEKVQSIWWGNHSLQQYNQTTRNWIQKTQSANGVPVHGGVNTWPAGYHNEKNAIQGLSCGVAESYILTVNVGTNKNSQSLVLMLEYGNVRIIFGGDAEGVTEKNAIANYKGRTLEGAILAGSHHGADTAGSNSPEWAAATKPRITVFNAGVSQQFKHPRCTSMEVYEQYLADSMQHSFECGRVVNPIEDVSQWERKNVEKAEYITEDQGRITVTVTKEGEVDVDCSRINENCSIDLDKIASAPSRSEKAADRKDQKRETPLPDDLKDLSNK